MFSLFDLPTILGVGRDRSVLVHTQYKYLYYSCTSSIVSSTLVKSLLTLALEVGGLRCLRQASRAVNSPDFKNSRTTFIATKLDPTGSTWRHSRMCLETDLDAFSMALSKSVSYRLSLHYNNSFIPFYIVIF